MHKVSTMALLAGAGLFVAGAASAAEDGRPSWAAGMPEDNQAAQQLAPIAPPPLPTPENELPLDQLAVPEGFAIEVYASGLANARSMTFGEDGTLFVGTRNVGKVYAVTEENGEVTSREIATGLHRPNGVAFKDGSLYVAELSRILRYDDIEANLDNPPEPTIVYDDLPTDEPHGWKFIAIGPDDNLYVPIGAPCNICDPSDEYAQIRKVSLDGTDAEVVARGVRNTVGFDFHPQSGNLWFTDNGRDWFSENVPHDELNEVTSPGEQHFGYPYCHQGDLLDDQFGWGHDCANYDPPAAKLGAHTAALGAEFYEGEMFPEEYRNQLFIARHGPWNKVNKDEGGDVIVAVLDEEGNVTSLEDFLTGFLQDNEYLGRPVDVEVMEDGSMLVSDDYNGAIYRITYEG